MAIKKIQVKNFKSFKDLKIELGKFDVLIGANASGKSNFVEIFRFLRNIVNFGLKNAISMQGGVEYLRNMKIHASENFSVNIFSDHKFGWLGRRRIKKGKIIAFDVDEVSWGFALKFKRRGSGFEIIREDLMQKFNFVSFERGKRELKAKEKLGEGKLIYSCTNGKLTIDFHKQPKDVPIEKDDVISPYMREEKLPRDMLLIQAGLPFRFPLVRLFSDVSIYDFDPRLPKKATPITGKAELEEDGSNLSIVLKNIIEQRDQKRKFFNLMKELLPFIAGLDVERFADKSLLFTLREIYSERQHLPASLISDGTINIAALIVALYFEEKLLTIIEEPGRNIHPHLISKVIEMFKDASRKKQIIITTHNPEIVRTAGLGNILLVSRDKEGFSTISRPADKEEIKTFLKNEIGIEELYVQDLLEV
ncbi:hypothetical protein ES705_06492 [subsurface metagenome]|nr:AAA family ATPase [Clostridia bacterium]